MKKLNLLLLGILWSAGLYAQGTGVQTQDSLLAHYNRDGFQGVYGLGTAQWKQKNKAGDISGWLG